MTLSLSQLVERASQVNRAGIATAFGDRRRTWSELRDRISRLAAGLRSLGVVPGDRVGMLALNSDRYLEWFFAVPWAGGVFVPVNTRLAVPEIAYWLNDSGTEVLFLDDHFSALAPKLRNQLENVREWVHLGDGAPPTGFHSFEQLIEGHQPSREVERGGADLAGLFYTGGTTGRSKGVMLSHHNLISNALHMLTPLDWRQNDVFLHSAPMFHLADGTLTFCSATLAASNCFIEAFDPEATLRAIQEHRVTQALLVPTMINMLVSHPEAQTYDLSSLRGLTYGASPMPEAVIRKAMALMPHVKFHQAYGQTEAAPVLTVNGPEYHVTEGPNAARLRSAGLAVPGVQLAILDEDDRELPRGAVGQICARGNNVMLGYWNIPELTAQTLAGGWLHTGDGGTMDEDGFLFVVDRVKDMIISGGENVYSAEVENAIHQHPTVAECAVIAIPDEKWGERVHAIVRLRDGGSLDQSGLIAHCRTIIADFKCPRSVEFRSEALPISGAGKILKAELRKPYWEGRDRRVN
jgi:long-chain acyl-CoA synthetase